MATATTVWADTGFGQQKAAPYLAPDGSFAAQIPQFWQPKAFLQDHVVEFHMPGAGAAWVQVRRLPVEPGTSAKQLLLRARELRLRKLPHYTEMGHSEVLINGNKAANVLGEFWYQGNAEYPRAVEEMFVVVGSEAFEIHFECFAPLARAIRGDLNQFYMSFVTHPGAIVAPPAAASTSDNFFENLPF